MAEEKNKSETEKKLAVILVRGLVEVSQKVKDTLSFLNLKRKNNCVILDNTLINQGMIKKVKDYVTWGEIDDATCKEIFTKRGREIEVRSTDSKNKYSYNFLEVDGKKYSKTFCLSPPRKGFARKGIKTPFTMGGALGYRAEKIKDLIERML
jgi:large subunit ribosomal protein L30